MDIPASIVETVALGHLGTASSDRMNARISGAISGVAHTAESASSGAQSVLNGDMDGADRAASSLGKTAMAVAGDTPRKFAATVVTLAIPGTFTKVMGRVGEADVALNAGKAADVNAGTKAATQAASAPAMTTAKTVASENIATDVVSLTQKQQSALRKLNNAVADHLTPSDISGAVADQMGSPIPKPTGGYWDHAREVSEALRGVRKNSAILEGVNNPAARDAVIKAQQAAQRAEDAIKGAGI